MRRGNPQLCHRSAVNLFLSALPALKRVRRKTSGGKTSPADFTSSLTGFRGRKQKIFSVQLILALDMRRIERNAIDRTHDDALRLFVMAHALGASLGIDDVDFFSRRYRAVRAFRFANIAIDALVGDNQCH
jgi:hypothetical protein